MRCPICNSTNNKRCLSLNTGKIDYSNVYEEININICNDCEHVFNDISPEQMNKLIKYYNEEYAPANLDLKVGDRPGSDDPFTKKRHEGLYKLLKPYLKKDSKILDVGCAMGGFLDFLNEKGYQKLYGIDIIQNYVDLARYNVQFGSVYSIPFKDKLFDVIVLDQVLEHLKDLKPAIQEIKRVLKPDGIVCVGVPDASMYEAIYFFDFYWLLMKEHIQHFDLEHLKLLFGNFGFEEIQHAKNGTPMMSELMILPNLNVIFRRISTNLKVNTTTHIQSQFRNLVYRKNEIIKLVESKEPLYVWGIGREFHYLFEQCGLKDCNIISLVDDTKSKQGKTVHGRIIMDSSILKEAEPNSKLIITAYAHKKILEKKASEIGFKGEIINV